MLMLLSFSSFFSSFVTQQQLAVTHSRQLAANQPWLLAFTAHRQLATQFAFKLHRSG